MKTFRCNNCGHELKRPTQPYSCPQCGRQAVGLFKVVPVGGQPAQPGVQPPAAGVAPVQTGVPPAQPTVPPTQPGVPPAQHGGVSPIAAPPPPPGTPAAPQPGAPPGAQPTQTPPAQPIGQPPAQQTPPQPAQQPPSPPAPQAPRPRKPQKPQAAPPPLPKGGKGGKPRPATPPTARRPARPKAPQATPPGAARPRAKSPRRTPQPATPKPKPPKPRPKIRPEPIRPKEFVWAYPDQPPYNVDAKPMRNAPAVDPEGRIIFCAQGRLLAMEDQGEAGPKPKILWEYVIGCHVPGPVVVATDGSIRAHSGDGFLHCVSSVGKQVWAPAHVGEPLGWAAPVCDEEGNTYISAYDGGLIRVDNDGKMGRKPYFRSRRKFDSAGVILGPALYIGAEDGYLFAIRLGPNRGESIWDHATEQGYTGGYLNSSPAVTEDGVLVVAARDELLYGFAPSGAAVWATRMPGMLLGSPVIDPHGHVYVGVSQAQRGQEPRGLLVSVDGNSHKIRWQYQAAGPVECTPVVGDDDTVYFGDDSGTIHAVDARGTAKWTARVEAAIRSAGAIIAPERLAFGLDDDTLVVLKCSSQSLAPGGWPKIACTLAQTGMAPPGTTLYGEETIETKHEQREPIRRDAAQPEHTPQGEEHTEEERTSDEQD